MAYVCASFNMAWHGMAVACVASIISENKTRVDVSNRSFRRRTQRGRKRLVEGRRGRTTLSAAATTVWHSSISALAYRSLKYYRQKKENGNERNNNSCMVAWRAQNSMSQRRAENNIWTQWQHGSQLSRSRLSENCFVCEEEEELNIK